MKKLAAYVAAVSIVLGVGALAATAAQADERGRIQTTERHRTWHR